VRVPIFVVAEAESVGMNFLTHNLLQFVFRISDLKSESETLKSEILLLRSF
jgi:hypothetical protein